MPYWRPGAARLRPRWIYVAPEGSCELSLRRSSSGSDRSTHTLATDGEAGAAAVSCHIGRRVARREAPSEVANGGPGGNASAGTEGHDRRPAGGRESGPRKYTSWRLQRLWGRSEESSGNSASPPSRARRRNHFYSSWKSPRQTQRGLSREEARAKRERGEGKAARRVSWGGREDGGGGAKGRERNGATRPKRRQTERRRRGR